VVRREQVANKESRETRFLKARELVDGAKVVFEDLQNELQEWLDNMPENLQESYKAEELQDTIDGLDEVIDDTEEIVTTEIEFPRMIG